MLYKVVVSYELQIEATNQKTIREYLKTEDDPSPGDWMEGVREEGSLQVVKRAHTKIMRIKRIRRQTNGNLQKIPTKDA
jgi:hypothetical protein